MSKFSSFLRLASCAAAAAWLGKASAQAESAPLPDLLAKRPSLIGVHAQDTPAKTLSDRGEGYQIRCWQYGRLLFEENHLDLAPTLPDHSITLQSSSGTHPPVYLLDSRNGNGLCLIKPSDPQSEKNPPPPGEEP